MNTRIERFLTGKMNSEEQRSFEQELANKPELREEVKAHRIALKAIRLEGRAQLKKRLAQLTDQDQDVDSGGKNTTLPKIFILFIFASVALLCWFYFKNATEKNIPEANTEWQEKKEIEATDSTNIKTPPLKTPETNKPKILPQKPTKTKPPIAKTPLKVSKNKALFAQYFEPYHHPSMRPNVRGQGDLSVREQFELAYWEKDYPQVVKLWNELSELQKSNGNLLFLKAVALLNQKSVSTAKADFEQLIQQKKHRFVQQSEWYVALIALQQDNTADAKNRLIQISKNIHHKYYRAALDLLREIERGG